MFRPFLIGGIAALTLLLPARGFPQAGSYGWIGAEFTSPAVPLSEPNISDDAFSFVSDETIYHAIREVTLSPPPGLSTLFDWKGDRLIFSRIKISFYFSTARTEQASIELAESSSGQELRDDARAFTMPVLDQKKDGSVEGTILVIFLVDNMFLLGPSGLRASNEEPWVTVATSVAHEVYGTVQAALEGVASGELEKIMNRRGGEVRAHQAGIDFLVRLKSRFPESTPAGRQIEVELKRQKTQQDEWRD